MVPALSRTGRQVAEAQLGLGILYEQGWGVPEDYVLAYAWYNLASGKGTSRPGTSKMISEHA